MKPEARRIFWFVTFCAVISLSVVSYALYAKTRSQRQSEAVAAPQPAIETNQSTAARNVPYLAFRNTALGPGYGCMSFVPLDNPEGPRIASKLACDRVHATADAGIALQASRRVFTTYKAVVFDADANVKTTFNLAGAPSRARIAPSGNYAASTVFVTGDSYASTGFSTRTTIYDLRSATIVGDLEQFSAEMNGREFRRVDFNYWGVTFVRDTDEFYATLSTGGIFYLVKGSVSKRHVRVVREGVECPSLSPDGARIAYKSRTMKGGQLIWRLRVLNLTTGEESTINEDRSVDDQAEWLDREHVLYGLPRNVAGSGSSDIWVARADGTGSPRMLVRDGWSPSVVRLKMSLASAK